MSSSGKRFVLLAAVSLLMATLLGAFSSHGISDYEPRALAAIQTAVEYQFYHGLALLAVALLGERIEGPATRIAGWAFIAGTLLFCGGIYASSLAGLTGFSRITPFGGLAFIAGWLALVFAALRGSAKST
jgi:uncharacterized membrane protein YgdD (TMEM256/DUF423 family)